MTATSAFPQFTFVKKALPLVTQHGIDRFSRSCAMYVGGRGVAHSWALHCCLEVRGYGKTYKPASVAIRGILLYPF